MLRPTIYQVLRRGPSVGIIKGPKSYFLETSIKAAPWTLPGRTLKSCHHLHTSLALQTLTDWICWSWRPKGHDCSGAWTGWFPWGASAECYEVAWGTESRGFLLPGQLLFSQHPHLYPGSTDVMRNSHNSSSFASYSSLRWGCHCYCQGKYYKPTCNRLWECAS